MLRSTPTSISLSTTDVAFVQQRLDIYEGLLKQGFKKEDILRYFNEHHKTSQSSAPPDENEDLRAPSTVELAIRGPRPPVGHVSPPQPDDANPEGQHDASDEAEDERSPPRGASSSAEPLERTQRHAPRQSSLLRFGQNASPLRSDESRDLTADFRPPVRTYRPRTETYSYNQSEISESDLVGGASALNESDENATSYRGPSGFRAEAKDFMPGTHRRALRSLRNASPLDYIPMLPATLPNSDDIAPAGPDSASLRRPFTMTPTTPTDGEAEAETEDSLTLPAMPPTPTPHRPAAPYNLRSRAKSHATADNTTTRTPPRPAGAQLDGTHPFNVYNDALPPLTQPQTPADLARHPLLTEHDAAYTAPVGTIRSPSRHIRRDRQSGSEEGIQSLTARAITNQSRRARELERTVRLEVGRMHRERVSDRAFMEGRPDAEQRRHAARTETDGGAENDADAAEPAMMTGALDWRDDLEGDRVGMENWEIDEAVTGEVRGPRVLSGNARRFWD